MTNPPSALPLSTSYYRLRAGALLSLPALLGRPPGFDPIGAAAFTNPHRGMAYILAKAPALNTLPARAATTPVVTNSLLTWREQQQRAMLR